VAYIFDEDFLAQLRMKCDIETVVSRYVQLRRAGSSLMGLCPFHNEKTPSFHVHAQKGFFHCFGCGAGGDVISFVMKVENLTYPEAVVQLAESVGMDIPKREGYAGADTLRRKAIFDMNRKAARFFYNELRSPRGRTALEYFHKRGLTDKTITKFGLGYSPDSWDSLLKYLIAEGYDMEDIKASGLVTVSQKDSGNVRVFDRFRNRVMFPIIDQRYNVIGFGGRAMGDDPAKYLNTSETMVFKKGQNLYAMNVAKSSGEKGLILCEGYMDVIALHQAGFTNAVATLGTALTPQQAKLMKRITSDVILCYDSDEAGRNATRRALDILANEEMKVKVITVTGGKDPDEFIKTHGADSFRKLIDGSLNRVDYKLNEIRGRYAIDIPEEKVECMKEMVAVLAGLRNKIELEVYIKRVSEQMGISVDSISAEIGVYLRRQATKRSVDETRKTLNESVRPTDTVNPQRSSNPRAAAAEDAVITLLLNCPEYLSDVTEIISADDFVTDFNRKIFSLLSEKIPHNTTAEPIMLLSQEINADEMGKLTAMVKEDRALNIDRQTVPIICRRLKDEKQKTLSGGIKGMSDSDLDAAWQRIKQNANKGNSKSDS